MFVHGTKFFFLHILEVALQASVMNCTSVAKIWIKLNSVCSVKCGQARLKYCYRYSFCIVALFTEI
jgi:hypothetical protein